MRQSFEQFMKSARNVTLPPGEKDQLRRALLATISESKSRTESFVSDSRSVQMPSKSIVKIRQSDRQSDKSSRDAVSVAENQNNWLKRMRSLLVYELSVKTSFMAIAILLVILLGGGTSYAAVGALPGEVLYPIKINVNEKVQGLLAVSAESEASLRVDLASARLEEAEILASENKLTADLADDISVRFSKYERDAQEHIAKLKEKEIEKGGNESGEESARLEANLKAHETLLNRFSRDNGNAEGASKVNVALKSRLLDVVETRKKHNEDELKLASTTVGVERAALGKKGAAENKLDEVTKFVDRKIVGADAEVRFDVGDKLQSAKNIYAEGTVLIANGDYESAFNKFNDAIRTAQEAKTLVDVGSSIKFSDRSGKSADDNDDEDEKDKGSATSTQKKNEKGESKAEDKGSATSTIKRNN